MSTFNGEGWFKKSTMKFARLKSEKDLISCDIGIHGDAPHIPIGLGGFPAVMAISHRLQLSPKKIGAHLLIFG